MELRSGLSGGRYHNATPVVSINARISGDLWLDRLSMTTISPCRSVGTNTCLTFARKAAAQPHHVFLYCSRLRSFTVYAGGPLQSIMSLSTPGQHLCCAGREDGVSLPL